MLMSRRLNARQNHNIKITNRLFENVGNLKYLGTEVAIKSLMHAKIKSRYIRGMK
jgi:hypothetical protein